MISYGEPIIKFGKTLVNLSQVESVRVKKESVQKKDYSYDWVWKMTVQFIHGRSLMWSYDSEQEAYDAMDKFHALNETYMMSEFPS